MATIDSSKNNSKSTKISAALVKKLGRVLAMQFSNGFRIGSPIELARLRRFLTEANLNDIQLSDEDLIKIIINCGISFEGKVYIVLPHTINKIKATVNDYFNGGAQIIFFAEFYIKNENWLFEANVISKEMLASILYSLYPELKFESAYFCVTHDSIYSVLEKEILRVWDNNVLLTYGQLAEKLPYIPLERIKVTLVQNGEFIWNSEGTFSHIAKVNITEDERKTIRDTAQRECRSNGYVSIINLPFGEIIERNHELSMAAVHSAIFRICLSDNYDKNGKIITRKGVRLDAQIIMKNYCRTIDKCSLSDLIKYEKELTGESHRWIPMEAGNAILIRIDKDTYIADKYVRFDSDVIDRAIGQIVTGEYLPLIFFTTFSTFPDCGQMWNLFLLESYSRRFSKKFRFDTSSVNSKNAGAVIHKSCTMTYTEIMADAVAKSNINLTESVVGKFLFENGYIGKGATAKAGEIIGKVKTLRKKRG